MKGFGAGVLTILVIGVIVWFYLKLRGQGDAAAALSNAGVKAGGGSAASAAVGLSPQSADTVWGITSGITSAAAPFTPIGDIFGALARWIGGQNAQAQSQVQGSTTSDDDNTQDSLGGVTRVIPPPESWLQANSYTDL